MSWIASDTGPLLHLAEAGLLEVLSQVGPVMVPPAVVFELERFDLARALTSAGLIQTRELHEPYPSRASSWLTGGLLDRGEAEALALAQQEAARWFLTDDTAARLLAKELGVETHGSLGILLWATAEGRLKRAEAEAGLERLNQSSLWISKRVLAEARLALRDLASERPEAP